MFPALLLPLFIGGPTQPAVTSNDDPPIRLWINNDRTFLPGDQAKVEVRTKDDGYLLVFHVDPNGHLRVLFPLDPDQDNFIRGGRKYEIRGRGGRESFEVDNETGKGTVYAAVSRDPLHFDGFVLGDHWDYRSLAPSRLADDPEPELNDLVRRIAQTDFDYDLLNYYVSDRVAYGSDYSPSYYGSAYYDPGCYGWSCNSYYGSPYGLSIGLFFGRPYRRYYYDPYYYAYNPFYNPFFYDPYYYAAVYHPRYVYPYSPYYGYPGYSRYYGYPGYSRYYGYPGYSRYYGYPGYSRYYGYPGYRGRYYNDGYGTYPQPYTPYRFRGADGFTAGPRDFRRPARFVNTVYSRPISTVRGAPVASPARRLAQPIAEAPISSDPRREVVGAPRLERREVQARRAGQPAIRVRNRGEIETRSVTREIEGRRSAPREGGAIERRQIEQPQRVGDQRREAERAPSRDAWPQRVPPPDARPARREADRGSGPEARPIRGSERVSMPESRPERREVGRPSAPAQDQGGMRSVGEGGRRHR